MIGKRTVWRNRLVPHWTLTALLMAATPLGATILEPMPAVAQAANVVLENVTIDFGVQVLTLKRIEIQNSTLTAAELQSLLDGKASNAAELLAKFDADKIAAPELKLEQVVGAMKTSGQYTDLAIQGVSKGRVGAWSIGGFTMTLPTITGMATPGASQTESSQTGAPQADVAKVEPLMSGGTMRMNRMSGKDIDLVALLRVLTTKKSSADEPFVPLYGPAEIESYVIDTPTFEMRIGTTRSSGIAGRPMAVPLYEALKSFPKIQPGTQPKPEEMQPMMAMVAGIYTDFAFGDVEVDGITVKSKNAEPAPVDMAIARVSMHDFKQARIGDMSMEGLSITTPQGKVNLGQFGFRGLDFASMIKMLEMIPQMEAAAAAGQPSPMDPRTFVPSIGGISLKGLAIDVEDPNKPGQRLKMSLENFDLATSDWLMAIPTRISATLDHLVMPVPPEQATETTKQLGIETLDLSSKVKLGWTEATQAVDIETLSIDAGKLGSVAAKGQVGNISREAFTTTDEFVRQAALLAASLRTVEIAITNGGAVELILAQAAKDGGTSVDEYKSSIIAGVSVVLPAMLGNSEGAKTAAAAIAKFVAAPKSLKLSATAPNGFGASDMMDPTKIGDKLKIQATANE